MAKKNGKHREERSSGRLMALAITCDGIRVRLPVRDLNPANYPGCIDLVGWDQDGIYRSMLCPKDRVTLVGVA